MMRAAPQDARSNLGMCIAELDGLDHGTQLPPAHLESGIGQRISHVSECVVRKKGTGRGNHEGWQATISKEV
eukprot:349801-Chlamydomonas_euryale.AAC.65